MVAPHPPTNRKAWFPLATQNYNTPPVVKGLRCVFKKLPDRELLRTLKGPRRRGRRGYAPRVLWYCYIVGICLRVTSVADLIRLLNNNPFVAAACGIDSPAEIPHESTFSRFYARLAWPMFTVMLKDVTRALTRLNYGRLPDFGKSVAIDSTDIKAWSNGGKRGGASDPDAGWCVKANTDGNKKYVWGYKVHILADTEYELPLVVDVSAGNLHDVKKAEALLAQARYAYPGFCPKYVICDAGYSSDRLRRAIRRHYRSRPIIDPNPRHLRAAARTEKTPEWKAIYRRRTAIERLNGRLKGFFKLNSLRVRGRHKVMVHALLSVIVLQAVALAFPDRPRSCVRAA